MRAILFDFDGVLIQSMEDHYEGWRRALKEYGIDMNPEELYMIEGQGLDAVAQQLGRKYNLPVNKTPAIIKKKQEYYEQVKKIRFYPNLLDVLNWAKEKELKMSVVTGGKRMRVMETLESFGLISYFNTIITSDDVVETKPSPEPYLAAASSLNIEAEHCIVVENAPLGIRSGKAAQMKVIAMTTTLNAQYLKEADVVVGDFKELLNALKKLY